MNGKDRPGRRATRGGRVVLFAMPRLRLTPQSDRAGRRVRLDVADAQVPAADALLGRDAQALAGEDDLRLAAQFFDHLDVRPGDPAAPSGADDLEHGFLRRESAGQVLEVPLRVRVAVRLFGRR